jgi:integrase/recombinase XerD
MPRKGQIKPKAPIGDAEDPESLFRLMQRYLNHLAEKNYSVCTIEIREEQLRYFLKWCEERAITKPRQLDRAILEQYQRSLFYYRKANGESLATSSQHVRIVHLRHWMQWLLKQGHILYNPAALLELPRLEKRLPKAILTAKEAETVLAVPDVTTTLGLRDRAILETFYSTGMRRMELANLHVHDVDSERGTVTIRQGKGKKDRVVPIGDRALEWVRKYMDTSRPQLVGIRDDGTLFLSTLGQPLVLDRLSQLVKECVDAAGIGKRGSCHMFRHTAATLMLEGGADIRIIQAFLGHVKLDTTQIYAQVSIKQLKAVHAATHPGRFPQVEQHRMEEHP